MGFLMDGLDADSYDRSYPDRVLVRRILGYFRPRLPAMSLVAAMIVLASSMWSALPLLISRGLDEIVAGGGDQVVGVLVALILVSGVLGWVFNFFRQSVSARVVGDVVLTLREDAFAAVLKRDLSFYDEHSSGKVVSRVTSDTDDFATVVTLTMDLLSQLLLIAIVTALLFARDTGLALLALAVTPVIVLVALGFRRLARESTRRMQRSTAKVNANVAETMGGIAVAKNFRQEQTLYDEFQPINRHNYQVQTRASFIFSGIFPLLFFIAGLGEVLLVYAGGRSVLAGDVSAGDWYLFLQAIAMFWFPLTSIASFWSQFQQGLAAAERVFALVDATPRVQQHDNQPVGRLTGRIELRDVVFSYAATDTPGERVLDGFNLTIEPGEMVALVGHTGAGKSTLGKLITRFYEFQGGEVRIDGRDIRSFDLADYRRQLGMVPQAPFLFSGTVADNIGYPRPDATPDAVRRAAEQIGGGDWLASLPNGLDTEVGEHGQALSMGQRQLVALARLLIQDPAIVILDEATASVDPLTEALISEGLDTALHDRTSIVIAHRLSTIQHADRIIVLRKGRIVEEGDHTTLMHRGGEYCEVYNTYFRHQSPHYQPGTGFVSVSPAAADPAPA